LNYFFSAPVSLVGKAKAATWKSKQTQVERLAVYQIQRQSVLSYVLCINKRESMTFWLAWI